MMQLGFSGTQQGMTRQQEAALRAILALASNLTDVHHGCCKGADTQFHYMVCGDPRFRLVTVHRHWPEDNGKTTACKAQQHTVDYMPKPFLKRNLDIAEAADRLIITPKQYTEVLRSGTWSTARYAARVNTPVDVIWPDGKVKLLWQPDGDL